MKSWKFRSYKKFVDKGSLLQSISEIGKRGNHATFSKQKSLPDRSV